MNEMRAAFSDPVHDSQRCFRAALAALAEPLLPQTLPALPAELPGLMPATAALLYALLDQDVSVWLPPLPADTLASLRFHTGLRLAAAPEQADFVVLPLGAPPPLAALKAGEPEYPDRSATVLLETAGFNAEQVEADGPGFAAPRRFGVDGAPDGFWRQWRDNHARFPLGVDIFLICGERVAGLPRSTRVKEG